MFVTKWDNYCNDMLIDHWWIQMKEIVSNLNFDDKNNINLIDK